MNKEIEQTNNFIKKRSTNFFKVPHKFEEGCGELFTSSEKYFFVMLCKLENRFGTKEGWFWHIDKEFETKKGSLLGFKTFGLSSSTCKRARKKLKKYDLVEIKSGWNKSGHRSGTWYRIKWEKFEQNLRFNIKPLP